MAEHPLIFSAPMIRAILEGRKSVTRRLADYSKWKKGDRVWVQESFAIHGEGYAGQGYGYTAEYAADGAMVRLAFDSSVKSDKEYPWSKFVNRGNKPSIHMPRTVSRITLELTENVRREPLNLLTEEEAKREGIVWVSKETAPNSGRFEANGVNEFKSLWNKMHPEHPWESNPIVSVINFKRI